MGQRDQKSGIKMAQNNFFPKLPITLNLTFVGVSGAGEEEKGNMHLLPKQLLSSSMSS